MKRLFMLLIVLFLLYLGIQVAINLFSKGAINEYEIKNGDKTFQIKEVSTFDKNLSNYYFEIKVDDNKFKFQVYNDFGKKKSVIDTIEYFKDDIYECILPKFKNNILLTDIMCMNNGVIYYYNSIRGKDYKLDEFVSNIKVYDISKYEDNSGKTFLSNLDIYKDNLIENHYIGLTNYKGIYNVSKNFNSIVYNISLFDRDVYNQKLGVFVDKYFVTADYNKDYSFNEIQVIDLTTLKTDKIYSDNAINLDGYIQGVVDKKVYLFDKDEQCQYEINVENKNVIRNNKDNLVYYNNGSFTKMSLKDANNELKFSYNEIDYHNNIYERIDRVGNKVGYYYLYENTGNGYNVYRINIQDNDGLTYLFTTSTIDRVSYVDNYVYFINNSMIQVYNDAFGVKNILNNNELEFNKNIIFNVYSK